MSFIGIVTNVKNVQYMSERLSMYFKREQFIFITDRNIKNVRNVQFETIIIDDKVNSLTDLKGIISKVKYVILNEDLDFDFRILEDLNLIVVSYGFKGKSTFTISSVSENNIIICLQRELVSMNNTKLEPQEFEVEIRDNISVHAVISLEILFIIYQKIQI